MSGKIMVVDDEVYVCRALRKSLEDMSFNVVEAYDGDEALAVYRHERPEVVLLDVVMPKKDGLEVLRELKELDPEVAVIMISAVHEKEMVLRAVNEGAFDYITKPIDIDYLEMALKERLEVIGV